MMDFLFLKYGFNMWNWPWHEWFPKKEKCPNDCGTCKTYHISDCTRNLGCNRCNPRGIGINNY